MKPEFKWRSVKMVVGLGNPGAAYGNTFHNVGQAVLHTLAGCERPQKFSAVPRKRFSFLRRGGRAFVMSNSFMNESGVAVAGALRYFKAAPQGLLLVHDDSDLPLGTFRLSFGRGHAGHKGVQSVIAALRTKNFWRLRIGVREDRADPPSPRLPPSPKWLRRPSRRVKAGDFVLRRMTARQRALLATTARGARASLTSAPRGGGRSGGKTRPEGE